MAHSLNQLEFAHPFWLAALTLAAPLIYYASHSLVNRSPVPAALSLCLRLLLLLALVLALSGVTWTYITRQQFVVMAVDQSASISEQARADAARFLEATREKAGNDRVVYLPFAATPGTPSDRLPMVSEHLDPLATDIATAIWEASALIPPDYVPHVVLLSDGNATLPYRYPPPGFEGFRLRPVPTSTVPLSGMPEFEVYVDSLSIADRVRCDEPFEVEAVVFSTHADAGSLVWSCGTKCILRQSVKVSLGENRFHATLSTPEEGQVAFAVEVKGFRDTIPGNNRVSAKVAVLPAPRALVVEGRPGAASRLADALRQAKIDTEIRGYIALSDNLPHYDLVVLANVPAAAIPRVWMEAAGAYVRDSGVGLLVLGGDQAFTPGQYKNTLLEDLLPVASCVKQHKDRASLAMVLVIDRSGSMEGKSIGLAKEAARRVVELLDPQDQIGVMTFEDETQWVSPIGPCTDKAAILQRVAAIKAEGPTNMHPAIEKAYMALRETFARRKHIIVLTDGMAQMADFHALAERIAAAEITISTLGIGAEAVGAVLADIARIGGGRYYACPDAAAVPSIFVEETKRARKEGITEGACPANAAKGAAALAGLDLEHLPAMLGYAETQAKPGSESVLTFDAGDPLLAWWRCGRGTTAIFTSGIEPHWAAAWLKWPDFDSFWTQVARHTMRGIPSERRTVCDYPEELRVRPTNVALLKQIAETTGGRYDPKPAEIFTPPTSGVPRTIAFWSYLLTAGIVLFFLDVVVRRMGSG